MDEAYLEGMLNVDFPKLTSKSPKFISRRTGEVTMTIGEYEKQTAIELARPIKGSGVLKRMGFAIKNVYYHCLPGSYFARKVGFDS